ncbi:MAG: Deoxyguanosinetriphosphate triphosphohydrolase [Lentisphaerae bacterium ADurb.Bin242]|nr:MAG: Deoxyguanosinetriphosphate triphosphohydrolase [Lentisphaerae bacterium ADurb.Bin242]
MIRELEDQHTLENSDLAPFATHNRNTRGRRMPEEEHPFRTDFQRDRDRILHSRAFRRLEYKTQVFLNGTGDHYRTRLTHTIEVAAIARTIARSLRLNEDLTETISLAHDLGHTPFGHAGERALQRIMRPYGGFDHNLQALKVVDELEIKYPGFDGINLTWEVRSGLVKHRKNEDGSPILLDGEVLPPSPSLEAQIADVADDLTYYGHDVDDGLDSGLLNTRMLAPLKLWELASRSALARGLSPDGERFAAYTVRCLIDAMVGDVIRTSAKALEKAALRSPAEACARPGHLISFSPEFTETTRELRDFLYHNLYFHPELEALNELSFTRMNRIFAYYTGHPEEMGETARSRIGRVGLERAAADYIAGMTDRFAMKEYDRIEPTAEASRHGHP